MIATRPTAMRAVSTSKIGCRNGCGVRLDHGVELRRKQRAGFAQRRDHLGAHQRRRDAERVEGPRSRR